MEPVSLGVGIAGAISSSISIGTVLKKLTQQYRDAPDSYIFTIKQCSAVSGQLSLLQSLMLQESWSVKLGHDGETSDYFVTIVMNCAENLQELETCVGSIRLGLPDADGKAQGIKQKVKIMWKEEDVKTLLGRLETSKQDIGRVLTIVQAGSLARIETQMDQLKSSMDALARSKSTKYRAMRVPGGGIGGSESSIVVVPSTYPGAPPKESVAGSGVSLSDIDLSSVVLTTTADDMSIRNEARAQHITESIRSFLPMAGSGLFGNQMQALVDAVEHDRVTMQKQLSKAHETLTERDRNVADLSNQLDNLKLEAQDGYFRVKSEIEGEFVDRMSNLEKDHRHELQNTERMHAEDLIELKKSHTDAFNTLESNFAERTSRDMTKLRQISAELVKAKKDYAESDHDLEEVVDLLQKQRDNTEKKIRKTKLEKAALLQTLRQATDALRISNTSYMSLCSAHNFTVSKLVDMESAAAHLLYQQKQAIEFLDKYRTSPVYIDSIVSEVSNSLAQLVTDKFIDSEDLSMLHTPASSPILKKGEQSIPKGKSTTATTNSPPNATNSPLSRSNTSGTAEEKTETGVSVPTLQLPNPIESPPLPARPRLIKVLSKPAKKPKGLKEFLAENRSTSRSHDKSKGSLPKYFNEDYSPGPEKESLPTSKPKAIEFSVEDAALYSKTRAPSYEDRVLRQNASNEKILEIRSRMSLD